MEKAVESDRRWKSCDLRTNENGSPQRMLNALLSGTVVLIHRHRDTTEMVFVVGGRQTEVFYDDNGVEEEIFYDEKGG